VQMEVTEHQAEIKRCPTCGRQSRGQFPPEVKRAVQYGANLRSSLIYLKDYALLPYGRLRELMQDMFGVHLGGGTLFAMEQECAQGLKDTVQQIRKDVASAAVAHFDETGYVCRVRYGGCTAPAPQRRPTTTWTRGEESQPWMPWECCRSSPESRCTTGSAAMPATARAMDCATLIIFVN